MFWYALSYLGGRSRSRVCFLSEPCPGVSLLDISIFNAIRLDKRNMATWCVFRLSEQRTRLDVQPVSLEGKKNPVFMRLRIPACCSPAWWKKFPAWWGPRFGGGLVCLWLRAKDSSLVYPGFVRAPVWCRLGVFLAQGKISRFGEIPVWRQDSGLAMT